MKDDNISMKDEDYRRNNLIHNGSKDEIEADAIRDAKNDIARGEPRIYYISEERGFPGPPHEPVYRAVGIPTEALPLVRDLPKIQWGFGGGCCISERDLYPSLFVKIYNQEILRNFQENKH